MSILENYRAKTLLITLSAILFAGMIVSQITAYTNAVRFKNEMINRDYALAGYLVTSHPDLAEEIRVAFTENKTERHTRAGRTLLEQAGYTGRIQLNLIPRANLFYRTDAVTNLMFSLILGGAILLAVYSFLKNHYRKIDECSADIIKIMDGDMVTRLGDNEEGSLSKLAAAINEIMKEENSTGSARDEIMADFLDKSEHELERMQGLSASLLKLARLDAGIIDLNIRENLLSDIITQAVKTFAARLEREHKTLTVKTDGEVSYPCDREWLMEAVSNLIKNAVEQNHSSAQACQKL